MLPLYNVLVLLGFLLYCIEYRMVMNIIIIDRCNFFLEIKTRTRIRGHVFTLVKGQSRLDVRKYSFSQGTKNEWNKLSAGCVHSSSITDIPLYSKDMVHLYSCMLTIDKSTDSVSTAI